MNINHSISKKLKPGRPVCTRNGQEVRIICFDAKSENYPIVALVKEGYSTQEYLRTYTNEGEVCRNGLMHTLDLVMPLKKKTGWINIYHVDGEDNCIRHKMYLYNRERCQNKCDNKRSC